MGDLCVNYLLVFFSISFLLTIGCWYDCPSASKLAVNDIGDIVLYITTAKHKHVLWGEYFMCALWQSVHYMYNTDVISRHNIIMRLVGMFSFTVFLLIYLYSDIYFCYIHSQFTCYQRVNVGWHVSFVLKQHACCIHSSCCWAFTAIGNAELPVNHVDMGVILCRPSKLGEYHDCWSLAPCITQSSVWSGIHGVKWCVILPV